MNHNVHATGPMYHGGRRPADMAYPPQAHYTQNMYQYHPQHIPQSYHHQPPQQWPYYNMQTPMPRPYQQSYPPMMGPPFPIAQTPMSPRPQHLQHMPSASSIRTHSTVPPSPAPSRPPQSPRPSITTQRMSPPSVPPPVPVPRRTPFQPPLPWYSVPEATFPTSRARRRRIIAPQSPSLCVELPIRDEDHSHVESIKDAELVHGTNAHGEYETLVSAPAIHHNQLEPSPSTAASENSPAQPTTPTSPRPVETSDKVRQIRKLLPAVPAVPTISKRPHIVKNLTESVASDVYPSSTAVRSPDEAVTLGEESVAASVEMAQPESPQKSAPKSWADLVRRKVSLSGVASPKVNNITGEAPSVSLKSSGNSKGDIFSSFSVVNHDNDNKISFLKPRGLINTGNMCYMNSILQALVFCVPFYDFLEQVRRHAAYSFDTETPMVDAMIMFSREFPIIDAASSAELLNLRLKDTELEDYGDAFTPEFVYDAIRRLPRFASMRRGHQQDAEEFLGFLLEEMHEECVRVLKGSIPKAEDPSPSIHSGQANGNGWLEVGPKQKAAITRSAGIIEAESPITKIFGGKLRSELRVPGAKNSVTLEPYQPLQLDIGSPQINTITEALKGLTRSEVLHGDFSSPRGPGLNATKQVFVETLPPVLILHLKRFQYDNTGGTQKIWKKVGYPLELEIPKELFPPHKRGAILAHGGLPRYRLISVVYHHGKNASGGHYTVDMRRQNDREWIRVDDTIIRRVKSEDVADAGRGEDPKVLAAALEQHKDDDNTAHASIHESMRKDHGQIPQPENGWSQVNGNINGASKKWSGLANGAGVSSDNSGKQTPVGRYSIKDNKVAYILFYQKMDN